MREVEILRAHRRIYSCCIRTCISEFCLEFHARAKLKLTEHAINIYSGSLEKYWHTDDKN